MSGSEIRFNVTGKVQGVMFRKTFVQALAKRNLKGGATNNRSNKSLVHCTAIGEDSVIEELQREIQDCEKLNSWGAKVSEVLPQDHGISWQEHHATTLDYKPDDWKSLGVKFYI